MGLVPTVVPEATKSSPLIPVCNCGRTLLAVYGLCAGRLKAVVNQSCSGHRAYQIHKNRHRHHRHVGPPGHVFFHGGNSGNRGRPYLLPQMQGGFRLQNFTLAVALYGIGCCLYDVAESSADNCALKAKPTNQKTPQPQ